jgi:hypothetical protein
MRFLSSLPLRLCLFAAGLSAAARADQPRASFAPPFPATAAAAQARGIALEGFDPVREDLQLRPGDTVTALFTLREGDRRQQWLAEIKIVPLTPSEKSAAPREQTIYTQTGREFRLSSPPAAFGLRMFGPFRETDAPDARVREKTARFLVQQDYLSFGWDRMAELALRLREIGQEIKLGISTGKFSEEQIGWGKSWAAEARFTPEDETVCAKQGFAQVEFLMLADRTPGFRDIAKASVDMPSILSGLLTRNFGIWFSYDWKSVARHDAAQFGLSWDEPFYSLPFSLTMFGKHVANGTWLTTAPKPPLLTCGGVVGLAISPPNRADKQLEFRVIAARNGPAPRPTPHAVP